MFSTKRVSSINEARAYFKTHYLPDGSLSHGLQVYLNLLKNKDYQPHNKIEYAKYTNNVVEQVKEDYSREAWWPTVVLFMNKTERPDINQVFRTHKAKLWDCLTPSEQKEGKRIMQKYNLVKIF